MRWFKILFFVIPAISLTLLYIIKTGGNRADEKHYPLNHLVINEHRLELKRIKSYAGIIKRYISNGKYNDHYCFLIDMKLASGLKRFFVYDLVKDSVLQTGLVTHGSGLSNVNDSAVFSNEPGSNCTSTGKYKIGKSYFGIFGIAYKLYGLDKTNSNAFNRFVVLHAHPCVPVMEIAPQNICRSWGCPTVTPSFLNELRIYLDKPGKPILLWIFR